MWLGIDWRAVGVVSVIIFQLCTTILLMFVKFNDLKHAEEDIKELKEKREADLKDIKDTQEKNKGEIVNIVKEYTIGTNKQLEKLFREMRKQVILQVKRDAICNERHTKK